MTAVPAYGRDYKSAKAVKEDWQAGKDFLLEPSGQYANKDSPFPKGTTLNIRYKKLTQVCVVKVS